MEINNLLWWNNLKEGEKYLFSFLFIDRVKSTEDESKENAELFHRIVENAIIAFNGKLLEWHGDGNTAFFYIPKSGPLTEQAQFLSKKAVDAAFAIYEGLLSQKTIPHLRLKAYISINIGMLAYKKNMGEIKSNVIDVGGHILKACPSESILIHEDVCGMLADDEKNKFRYCGTTIKDNAPVFIYPKKSELGNKQNEFIPIDKDHYYTKTQYRKFIKDKYGKLIPKGLRQERLVSIDLFEIFSPLQFRIKEEFNIADFSDVPGYSENKTEIPFSRIKRESFSLSFSISDLLQRKRHSVVLGSPGSGKSTLIKWLALSCAEGKISITQRLGLEEELIPLPVSIGHLSQIWLNNNKGIGILDAIIQYFKIYSQDISEFIKPYLEQGRVFILFDGMDEIASDLEKGEIVQWIEAFIQRYSSNRFIITSRVIGFSGIAIDGDKYVIEDLTINEAKPLIEKWMTVLEKSQSGENETSEKTAENEAKKLIETLEKMPQFASFIKNPFFITLIVLIHRTEAALPRYRIQLFERMIQTLVETWHQARSIGIIQPDKQKIDFSTEAIPILGPLALWMHENFSAGVAPEKDLRKFIEDKLKKQGGTDKEIKKSVDNFLERLKKGSGLLEEKGKNLWGFAHLSFEEYLSAVELVRDELYLDYLKKYTYHSRWEEIFILVAGELGVTQKNTKKVSAYIREILNGKGDEINEDILKKHILLAGKCLGSSANVEKKLMDEIVHQIIKVFFSDINILKKQSGNVIREIKEMHQMVKEKIPQQLISEDLKVRGNAILTIGYLGIKDDWVIDVIKKALQDEDKGVRKYAIFTIVHLGIKNDWTIDVVRNTLKDSDPWIRGAAISAIGDLKIKDDWVIDVIKNALRDIDPSLRRNAIYAIGRLCAKDDWVIDAIKNALKDKFWWVRNTAISAINDLDIKDDWVIDVIKNALQHEKKEMRETAIFAIGELDIKDDWALDIINNMLKDSNPWMRATAISAIGRLGISDDGILDVVKNASKDNFPWMRESAIFAIGKLGIKDDWVQETLIKAIKDEKFYLKNEAYEALWKLNS